MIESGRLTIPPFVRYMAVKGSFGMVKGIIKELAKKGNHYEKNQNHLYNGPRL